MKAPAGYKTTAQAAKILGKSIRTLKNYHRDGKLIPALIGDNGYCYYSDAQLADFQTRATDIQTRATQNIKLSEETESAIKPNEGEFSTVSNASGMTENQHEVGNTMRDEIFGKSPFEDWADVGITYDDLREDEEIEITPIVEDDIPAKNEEATPAAKVQPEKISAAQNTGGDVETFRIVDDKKFVKETSPLVMASTDPPLLKMVEGKPNEIVCPYCGNGTGKSRTGIDFKNFDTYHNYYCQKCQKKFDNIDVAREYFIGRNFGDVLRETRRLINAVPADKIPAHAESTQTTPKEEKIYNKFVTYAASQLGEYLKGQGGKWRGLTYETLNRYMVGYAPSFGTPQTPRIILPTAIDTGVNKCLINHFMARFVGNLDDYSDAEKAKIHEKQHCGRKGIFGTMQLKASLQAQIKARGIKSKEDVTFSTFQPVFIVEGEIDAMTGYQLTGYEFLALGGSGLSDYQKGMLKNLRENGWKLNFVVMLDNDETGNEKAPEVAAELKALGYKATTARLEIITPAGDVKDLNDALTGGQSAAAKMILTSEFEKAQKAAQMEENQPSENVTDDEEFYSCGNDNDSYQPTDEELAALYHDDDAPPIAQVEETNKDNSNAVDDLDDFIADADDYSGASYIDNFFTTDAQIYNKFAKIKTGFKNLDEYTPLLTGLHFLGGQPGAGKSTLAIQLADNIARLNPSTFVLYATNEMGRRQIFAKRIARKLYEEDRYTRLTARDILRDAATDNARRFAPVLDYIKRLKNFLVLDVQGKTAEEIVKEDLKPYVDSARQVGINVFVFLDYLQLIKASTTKAGEYEKLNDAIDRFKQLQHETNTTFIIISAFNRAHNQKSEADLDSFKGTAGIEYGGETVLTLDVDKETGETRRQAMTKYPRRVKLTCLKNRNGALFDCSFDYYPSHDYFQDANQKTPARQENHESENDYYEGNNSSDSEITTFEKSDGTPF